MDEIRLKCDEIASFSLKMDKKLENWKIGKLEKTPRPMKVAPDLTNEAISDVAIYRPIWRLRVPSSSLSFLFFLGLFPGKRPT